MWISDQLVVGLPQSLVTDKPGAEFEGLGCDISQGLGTIQFNSN